MDPASIIQIISLIILVALSAFFSSAETAFSTVNRIHIRSMVEDGNKRANTVQKVLNSYSKLLSTILIGNNIVNLSASALATTLAVKTGFSWAVSVATGVLTVVVLIFGEIVPKTSAILFSERIALAYAPIMHLLMVILTPAIFLVDKISLCFLRVLHIDPNRKMNSITETELRTYVEASHEDGVIEEKEREMIYNVFDFGDALAKDIMIPRIDMVSIEKKSTYEDVMEVFRENMYTRIPVYSESPDNIIGVINIKDLLFVNSPDEFCLEKLLRDAYYTYEYKKTSDLMIEMRKSTSNIAFVLNEYGATEGMITMEDLLEEIVGEIRDEYDEDEELLIQETQPGVFLVPGGMKLDDINNSIGTEFSSEDYDSIGGLIIEALNQLPTEGESVTLSSGIILTVKKFKQNRIEQVLLQIPKTEEHESSEDE